MTTLQDIVVEVDRRAVGRPIGEIQNLRKVNRQLRRKASHQLFGYARTEDWTFHIGGRDELQFNLGFEPSFKEDNFRFGVAFSFETSRSMPTIDALIPKVSRFNDYLRENAEDFAGLWMWHWADGKRSSLIRPMPIGHELVRPGVFVFVGGVGSSNAPDYEIVLDTLDHLLPLYCFVENGGAEGEHLLSSDKPFRLGCPARATRTVGTLAEQLLDIDLRHNALQMQLYDELVAEFGREHVAVEHPAPGGGKIDMIVRTKAVRIIYEIKTASNARGSIREALGQLLDYACWPGGPRVDRVVIVGASPPTPAANTYLHFLNQSFPIPLSYRHIALAAD